MIEVLKRLKDLFPPNKNEKSMLKSIPYTIRNPKDLESQSGKTVCYGLETTTCKGPQLWQQLIAQQKMYLRSELQGH